MSRTARAAQFMPFKALEPHEANIQAVEEIVEQKNWYLYRVWRNLSRFLVHLFTDFISYGKIVPIMSKKSNTKRKLVGLVSEESGIRAYYTKKNTMNTPDKLSLKKYDPILRKHVVFTETKKNLGRNEVKEKKR